MEVCANAGMATLVPPAREAPGVGHGHDRRESFF
jgi:hypothetical protein